MPILIVILIGWYTRRTTDSSHYLPRLVLSVLCNLVCAMFFVRKLELKA